MRGESTNGVEKTETCDLFVMHDSRSYFCTGSGDADLEKNGSLSLNLGRKVVSRIVQKVARADIESVPGNWICLCIVSQRKDKMRYEDEIGG